MSDLQLKRAKLQELNKQLFELIKNRREIVSEIQRIKNANHTYACWDPSQEVKLFTHFKETLLNFSIKELLAFSLLMEDQAMISTKAYPAWSECIHLTDRAMSDCVHQMNPILLAVFNKDLYDRLPLKKEFQSLIDGALKNDE